MGDGGGLTALSSRAGSEARRRKWISPYWVLWFSSSLPPLSALLPSPSLIAVNG